MCGSFTDVTLRLDPYRFRFLYPKTEVKVIPFPTGKETTIDNLLSVEEVRMDPVDKTNLLPSEN